MKILEGLNEKQLEGVLTTDGPVLILAGAGSGKTRVLVSRAAYMLDALGVPPWELLAITFTNKAAQEMRTRMSKMSDCDASKMWIGTFHSTCLRILHKEIDSIPYAANFVIYDDNDQQVLIKKCIAELGLDEKRYAPRMISSEISKAKNLLWDPDKYMSEAYDQWREDIGRAYRLYQRRMLANNAMDFDDLIMVTVELLEKHPEVLAKYQKQFRYILVDEYQDTNKSQYRLIQLLADRYHNICVVGDPDQSIYGWRGADISNILSFEDDYPDAAVILLEENYRSTQNILQGANGVIEFNTERKPKQLWTQAGEGNLIQYHELSGDRSEATFVIEEILRLRQQMDLKYKDFAIIYRTHSQSRVFEDALVKYALPYRIFGGLRFYERREIKDTLAYLRVLTNPSDEISLYRIINVPKRAIGESTWQKLVTGARAAGISVYQALSNDEILTSMTAAPRKALKAFSELMEGLRDKLKQVPLSDFLTDLWHDTGYLDFINLEDEVEAETRRENLGEFLSLAVDFQEGQALQEENAEASSENMLADFLALLSLSTDMDNWQESDDFISLLTMHGTKGLEFPVVFMVGLEEKLFPHSRALLDDSQMEEERRLCYVGMTRAEKLLYVTRARERMLYGRRDMLLPSRFLDEIPQENLESHLLPERQGTSMEYFAKEKAGFASPFAKPDNSRPRPASPSSNLLINLGDKVQHAKFGVGVVVQVNGSGDDMQLMVAFPNEGIKTLMLKYAPIKKL